jgi:hypothetical protein
MRRRAAVIVCQSRHGRGSDVTSIQSVRRAYRVLFIGTFRLLIGISGAPKHAPNHLLSCFLCVLDKWLFSRGRGVDTAMARLPEQSDDGPNLEARIDDIQPLIEKRGAPRESDVGLDLGFSVERAASGLRPEITKSGSGPVGATERPIKNSENLQSARRGAVALQPAWK